MLIVASLATFVFELIRNEMMYREGVPLGVIGGGFSFSNLSFLWSPQLWSLITSRVPAKSKMSLFAIFVITGLIAATVGPAFATLLIPTDKHWDAGRKTFWLPGLPHDIWPESLTFSLSGSDSICTANSDSINYTVCPSGGYYQLWNYVTQTPFIQDQMDIRFNDTAELPYSHPSVTLPSSLSRAPGSTLTDNFPAGDCGKHFRGPHFSTAILQKQLLYDWSDTVSNFPGRNTDLQLQCTNTATDCHHSQTRAYQLYGWYVQAHKTSQLVKELFAFRNIHAQTTLPLLK